MEANQEKYLPAPNAEDLKTLSEFHRAMGDLTRMKILWSLIDGEKCVSAIAYQLNMTESAISHHLRILKFSRLIRYYKSGKNVFYLLDDEHIKWILEETYAHISERQTSAAHK